jgi:hypothetical protein
MFISVWFVGGMVMTGMGVLGIYIGKTYKEVKRRPRYFIDEFLGDGK